MPNELKARAILRRGPAVNTASGNNFYPFDPKPEDINLYDIAHALSNLCRYNGHVKKFYSVAEHSVLVAGAVSKPNKLAALLHDAAEAYVGDMISPIKNQMPEFKRIEDRILRVIFQRFNVSTEHIPLEVKEADILIRRDEMNRLLTSPDPYSMPVDRLYVDIKNWSPKTAEQKFMDMYHGITEV